MQAAPAYDFLKQKLHINDKKLYWRIFQVLRTILLVSLLRIFYCSPTVGAALHYIRLIFTPNWNMILHPGTVLITACAGSAVTMKYILAGTAAIFGVDLVMENEWKPRFPMPLRMVVYGLLICAIIIGAGSGNGSAGGFMYAQF